MLGKLEAKPAKDFMGGTEEEVEWLWESLVPVGAMTALVAFVKVGKSTLVYALLASLLEGRQLLGFRTRKSRILLLAVEETRRDVKIRLSTFGVTEKSDGLFVHVGSLAPSYENYQDIAALCREQAIDLVVVDTLTSFLIMEDENDNSEMVRALRPLMDLSRELNVALLLVHHTTKMGGENVRAVRGGGALAATMDQLILMTIQGDGDLSRIRRLHPRGRYDSPRLVAAELTEDFVWKLIGTETDSLVVIIQDEVQAALAGSDVPLTVQQLSKLTTRKVRNIQRALTPEPPWCAREGTGKRGSPFTYRVKTLEELKEAEGE